MSSLERLPSEDTDEKTLNSSEEESDGGNYNNNNQKQ